MDLNHLLLCHLSAMPDFLFFQFSHNINICQRETLDLFDMLKEQSAQFLARELSLAVHTEQVNT